jgi:hypothetical protein
MTIRVLALLSSTQFPSAMAGIIAATRNRVMSKRIEIDFISGKVLGKN